MLAIYGAIGANAAIAVTKLTVAGITGKSAKLSEGVHADVDTFKGVLLLVAIRLSQRPATPAHPFGHGKALYAWSLIVAVLVFGQSTSPGPRPTCARATLSSMMRPP